MRRLALALLLGCLLLVAAVSALDGYDYYQTIEYAACDQEVYQQDIVIHRSTGTAYNETAGGLETWHIYVGDHCREDYGDIRFTNSTGAELAYYLWPDYDSSSARFTVRLEGADAAGVLRVWYGNPSAATTSNGDAVYLFFDQFEGTALNTSKWDVTATSLTVSGGICTIPDSGWKGIATKATFGNGVMAVCHHKVYSSTDTSEVATMVGFSSLSSYDSGRNIYYSGGGCYEWPGGDSKPFATGGTRGVYASTKIIRKPAEYVMYNTAGDTRSASVLSENYPFVINKGGNLPEYYDYILVRTYSATPPAALTFSGEQEAAAPPITVSSSIRPRASATIPTLSTDLKDDLIDSLGGETVPEPGEDTINWTGLVSTIGGAYTSVLGPLAYTLIFSIPFLMMWITQRDMTLPGLVGALFGLFIIVRLPAGFHLVAVTFIVISIVAVIYSLVKERV